jgi:hypothetical protein
MGANTVGKWQATNRAMLSSRSGTHEREKANTYGSLVKADRGRRVMGTGIENKGA